MAQRWFRRCLIALPARADKQRLYISTFSRPANRPISPREATTAHSLQGNKVVIKKMHADTVIGWHIIGSPAVEFVGGGPLF